MSSGGPRENTGGHRNGAGRPKGATAKKTREIAEQAAAEGITPLEVMINAMRYYVEAGERDKAASIAKDAAPYMHPRLSSAIVKADVSVESTSVVECIITSREEANQTIAALEDASGVPRQ